jgi:hypothetical protein
MKKFNLNLEKLVEVIGVVTEVAAANITVTPTITVKPTSFNPVTETKVVEPEVKKTKKVKVEEPVVEEVVEAEPVVEEVVEAEEADERPPLVAKEVQLFAREKIAKYAEKDPDLKTKIKKKITDLGAPMITKLDQEGLVSLEKWLRTL